MDTLKLFRPGPSKIKWICKCLVRGDRLTVRQAVNEGDADLRATIYQLAEQYGLVARRREVLRKSRFCSKLRRVNEYWFDPDTRARGREILKLSEKESPELS
jgi:hypothetical protein